MKDTQKSDASKSRDIWIEPIMRRIIANPELGLCGLTREAGALVVHAARLIDMPQSWIDGQTSIDTDCVESIALLLRDVLGAVEAEIADPARIGDWRCRVSGPFMPEPGEVDGGDA